MIRKKENKMPPTIWTAHLRIEEGYDTEGMNHPLFLHELPDDPYLPSERVDLFAREDASDITGYRTLEKENGFGNVELTASTPASKRFSKTILIEEFVTNDDYGVGGFLADGTTTFKFTTWWTSSGPSLALVNAKCELHHRDAAGYENLITSFTQIATKTEKQYTKQVTVEELFEPGERLVVKWFMKFAPVSTE